MAIQDTPFWLFGLIYAFYLLPFILYLQEGGAKAEGAKVLPLVNSDALQGLLDTCLLQLWMCLLYAAMRALLSCFGWKQGRKLPCQHKDDFVRMGYLQVSLAVLGRLQGRFSHAESSFMFHLAPRVEFLTLLTYFNVFYTLLFEMVRFINMHLSSDLLSNLKGLGIVTIASIVIVGVLKAHLLLAFAQSHDFGIAYVAWVAFVVFGHVIVQMIPSTLLDRNDANDLSQSGQVTHLHVHHWYWSFIAAHFAIFDSRLSCLTQAAFLGIYIHGVACFGLEPIFEPSNDTAAKAADVGFNEMEIMNGLLDDEESNCDSKTN
eukprot:TRINITY_DN11135_c0_g1_i4.p1 TRINITY_DN11135_c0_g1~~TRINITY_DN11135_c0_g1_i4.p1  ORF type:complete len:332 (-),score=30.46 TRINITY_DN11135_c0_g1_i4:113-1066(-)